MEVKILITWAKPMESAINNKSWNNFLSLFNESPIISNHGTVNLIDFILLFLMKLFCSFLIKFIFFK